MTLTKSSPTPPRPIPADGAQGEEAQQEGQPGRRGGEKEKSVYKYVPGDWICPTCEDLQFRRNTTCRICGTMNPTVLAQELAHR